MKIINEKGKLFGIINIIDLCVLLVIVLALGAFGYKTFGKKFGESATSAETKQMFVTVKFTVTNEETINSLKVGDTLISLLNPIDGARIQSVSSKEAETQVQTADGKVLYVKDPKKKEVTVVFKMQASGGNSIIKLGSQDIAVGKTFILKTRTAEFSSTKILNVEIK